MPNTTNFNWPTPADTDLVKDGAAAIRNLGNGVDTSLVDLKGGTTGQILSKASNADMDFTFITPNVGDITEVQAGTGISVASGTGPIPVITNTVATAFDAAGDLIYGTGADTFTKLSIGTAGKVLAVNSGATAIEWVTPAGGKVKQVVGATTTTEVINNTNTYADTTLTATITPSAASSKIMVLITQNGFWTYSNFANNAGQVKIVRASTDIWATQFINFDNTATSKQNTFSFVYLDSPSTTSATTYKTMFRNVQNQQGVIVQESTAPSSIILLEIGA